MKTSTVLVLVAFVAIGMDMACAWTHNQSCECAEGIPDSREASEASAGLEDRWKRQRAYTHCLD